MTTIHSELSEIQELALSVLLETGSLPFNKLYSSIFLILARQKSLKDFADASLDIPNQYRDKIVNTKFDFSTRTSYRISALTVTLPKVTRSGIESEIEMLIISELIQKEWNPIFKHEKLDYILWEADPERLAFFILSLTPKGKEIAARIKENRHIILRPLKHKISKVFIASQIGDPIVKRLCNDYISSIVKNRGLDPRYITQVDIAFTITQQILEDINNSTIIIADLTFARPSVYFEFGFAKGLGLKSILTCRKDHLEKKGEDLKIHFDLEQFLISFWEYDENSKTFIWDDDQNIEIKLDRLLEIS